MDRAAWARGYEDPAAKLRLARTPGPCPGRAGMSFHPTQPPFPAAAVL